MAQSRWKSSEITFGPVGRIVATLVVVGILWWLFSYVGLLGLVVLPLVLRDLVPQAMRDIWRPVRLPPTDREILEARYDALDRAQPPAPGEGITDRTPPRRW